MIVGRDNNKPALYLENIELENGWQVKERLTWRTVNHNYTFSETYRVVNPTTGQSALLKALDFSVAFESPDPVVAMRQLTERFNFEQTLLEICENLNVKNIIKILASGKINPLPGSIIPVPYIIVEYSKKSIESELDFNKRLDLTWILKIMHRVTTTLWQMHKAQIAYNNLQPGTVLEFSKDLYKLSELGRAQKRGVENPTLLHLSSDVQEVFIMTPENLYGYVEQDWVYRCQAVDAYQLGNLLFFLFTQFNVNFWLNEFLDDSHKWSQWTDTYEQALPYLEVAFEKVIEYFKTHIEASDNIKEDLVFVFQSLCQPNPRRRGHPRTIASVGSSFSVERFFTIFKKLADDAELDLLKQ